MEPIVRLIQPEDSASLALLIKSVLAEFTSDTSGTIAEDPVLKDLYHDFQSPRAVYFTVWIAGELVGGCGVQQLAGAEPNVCELQRMFLHPNARGKGIAHKLITNCLEFARKNNFDYCYLETLSNMEKAILLYKKFGFVPLQYPMGNTGHAGCQIYMGKELK